MNGDLQRHFDTAAAFFLAAERCSFELKFGQYEFHSVSAPTIVNYALSVELALKLIHVLVTGNSPTGHLLKDLFDELPADTQANLPLLAECVTEMTRYFVDWRYPFEKDFLLGGYDSPRRAFIECYWEIKRLRPQLKCVYETLWGSFEPQWLQSWTDSQLFVAERAG